jgi:hypothetical protein
MRIEQILIAETDDESRWLLKTGLPCLPTGRGDTQVFLAPSEEEATKLQEEYFIHLQQMAGHG